MKTLDFVSDFVLNFYTCSQSAGFWHCMLYNSIIQLEVTISITSGLNADNCQCIWLLRKLEQVHLRNGKRAACNYRVMDARGRLLTMNET